MRVERVVLKDHGDVAVFGRDVVDDVLADADGAGRDFFQAGDHAQRRRFSTARRPDKDDEFAIGNVQTGIVYGAHATFVCLADVLQDHMRHAESRSLAGFLTGKAL